MVVKRRRKTSSRRKKSHYKRGRWAKYFYGGYMDDGNGFKVARDLSHISDQKKEFQKNYEDNKPSKFWLPSFLDHRANKNVIDDYTMNTIESKMLSGDPTTRQVAREQLKDMLLVRDIQTNPDDYMREWEAGKHKRNNWVKTATRVGLGTAAALGTGFLLYNWGTPMLGLAANGLSKLKDWWRGPEPLPDGFKFYEKFTNPKSNFDTNTGTASKDSFLTIISSIINKDPKKMSFLTKDNKGILGYNSQTQRYLIKGADGQRMQIKPSQLINWILTKGNKEDYAGIHNQANNLFNEYLKTHSLSGYGYRVTRRGRRLLRRYRRHLRHRRRH